MTEEKGAVTVTGEVTHQRQVPESDGVPAAGHVGRHRGLGLDGLHPALRDLAAVEIITIVLLKGVGIYQCIICCLKLLAE